LYGTPDSADEEDMHLVAHFRVEHAALLTLPPAVARLNLAPEVIPNLRNIIHTTYTAMGLDTVSTQTLNNTVTKSIWRR